MKAKTAWIVLLITVAMTSSAYCQNTVTIEEEPAVANIMEKFLSYNVANSTIPGWKIQIISTSDRREMDAARFKFSGLFSGMPVAWKHISPNYLVRVGAYRTKTDLLTDLQEIRKYFPMSTPVIETIDKKDLIKYE